MLRPRKFGFNGRVSKDANGPPRWEQKRGRGIRVYDVPMVRRIGYGHGLLFVLACVVAYPLTWGRMETMGQDSGGPHNHVGHHSNER
jgi:hypothetical protein